MPAVWEGGPLLHSGAASAGLCGTQLVLRARPIMHLPPSRRIRRGYEPGIQVVEKEKLTTP